MSSLHRFYKPHTTVREFMLSEAKVKCIIGPLGSGKSTGGIMELFRRACQQEPDKQGIRPTRFAVIRNTAAQIRDTFLADTLQLLPFMDYKVSKGRLELRLDLPDGTKVESDWLLMPLERPEDVRKLLSLSLTAALIEECREVDYSILVPLRGRLGRFPMKSRVNPTWEALMCISNPWSESSQWHENFVLSKPKEWEFFHQPGGLTPEAENVENLPDDYYDRLMQGASQDFINVHVHSMFGDDQFGQAVFRSSFNQQRHVIYTNSIRADPSLPLLIGMDFGRTPCAIIGQEDVRDRLLCLEEITSENMGLNEFITSLLLPKLMHDYRGYRAFIVADPAGNQMSQYSEENAFTVLKSYGLEAIEAPTNDIATRIMAVEKRLVENRGEISAFLIDGNRCPKLVRAFLSDYRYRKKRDGELEPKPDKNEASHISDATQYLCLGAQSNYVGREIMRRVEPAVQRKPRMFTARAWT